jgi:MarR family transcriptional regulator, lower aerobic nicotinate degradation pathway regulator
MSQDARPPRQPATQGDDLGLLDSLVQLSFAVQNALQRVADAHELSLVQVRLLGILRDREPGMFEVATFLNLDKSSVTGLVDRAERRGLVRRTSTPDDRRAVRVALSERGRELARKFAKQVGHELATLVAGLSDAERKRLSMLATQIVISDAQRRLPDVKPRPKKR